jgi:hypothetical protein
MTIKDFRGDMKSVAAASGNGVVGAIPGSLWRGVT